MARKYDASDINILETDRDRVQQQAHIYIPDKRLAGALHIIREIVDNSQDEVMNSSGEVIVTFDEVTRECTVKDNGRGIPLEKLQELCEVLNSSGKFNKGKNSAYINAGGLHGIGMKLANFLSEYFIITSSRDGKSITRYYEDGIFIKEKSEKSNDHGTFIRVKLSDKYLKELDKMRCKHIQKMIEEKTDACPGLITIFKGITKDGKKIKEKYTGLTIKELMKKYMKPTSKTWEYEFESKDGNTTAKLAFGYDSKATEGSNLMGWTNFIYNKDGGTHVDSIADSLFDVFKRYMLNNFFTDKEKKNLQIRKEDIKLGLCGVVVLLTTTPEFLGQYKERMISESIKEEMCNFLYKKLNKLPDSDMREISRIIRDNIKARMSSQKARQQVKKVGNGLSKDRIEEYIPPKMGCTTDYLEVYLCEGKSAANQVEKARSDFQAIYKLRGKVDNIYDTAIGDMSKMKLIEDLSRIIGLVPGKHGTIIPDRILALTDADPDGYFIRASIVSIMACAFPQVIEEGRLYMVEPPLFAFKDNGKKRFVTTNREYLTYLQKEFAKKNNLYRDGKKMDNDAIKDFLIRNERYLEYLQNVADNNICSPKFTELIISNIGKLGINKESIDKWSKLIKTEFSPQLKVKWDEGRITVNGIKDGNWESIEIDSELLESKKTKKLINIMNNNLNKIYGYSIETDKETIKNLSIYDVLQIFNKYSGKDLKRFKGLGEMEEKDLRTTCMDLENQRAVKITAKDVKDARARLADWHSKKESARDFRKNFMLEYIPDIQDIST